MDLRYKKQASCPDDETLFTYKAGRLAGDDRDVVAFHLLFCDACLEVLRQMPEESEAAETDEPIDTDLEGETKVSPQLEHAIAEFLGRKELPEAPTKTWEEVEVEGGLSVGQIWRTRFDRIIVPGRENEGAFSVADLDSAPHLVVILEAEAGTGTSCGLYHRIRVAPASAEVEYAAEGDLVVSEKDSPLGYALMLELWNEQSMLRENLDCCLGAFDPTEHKEILEKLRQGQEELHRERKKPLSLEQTVMKGLYRDPIMRFRAHEYEETAYLRVSAEALDIFADEKSSGDRIIDRLQGDLPGTATPIKSRCRLRAFSRLPLSAHRPEEINWAEYRVAAGSTEGDISIEKEQLSEEATEGSVIAETEQRGFDLVVHLLGPYEQVSGQKVTLCQRIGQHEQEHISRMTDEGGWVVFNLSDLPFDLDAASVGCQYFLLLDATQPVKVSSPSISSEGIELRKLAREIESHDPTESVRLFLAVAKGGDELDRDDAYDQLLILAEKHSLSHRLASEMKECLTSRPENDPHLVTKRNRLLEGLRRAEQK